MQKRKLMNVTFVVISIATLVKQKLQKFALPSRFGQAIATFFSDLPRFTPGFSPLFPITRKSSQTITEAITIAIPADYSNAIGLDD